MSESIQRPGYESRVNLHQDAEPRAKVVLEGVAIFFLWGPGRFRRGQIQCRSIISHDFRRFSRTRFTRWIFCIFNRRRPVCTSTKTSPGTGTQAWCWPSCYTDLELPEACMHKSNTTTHAHTYTLTGVFVWVPDLSSRKAGKGLNLELGFAPTLCLRNRFSVLEHEEPGTLEPGNLAALNHGTQNHGTRNTEPRNTESGNTEPRNTEPWTTESRTTEPRTTEPRITEGNENFYKISNVHLSNHLEELLRFRGKIDGHDAVFLIDSGSSHDFISDSFVNTRETAARIVLEDDIFRAMTLQVQYMAIHCTPKMKELNLCTNTWQNLHVGNLFL